MPITLLQNICDTCLISHWNIQRFFLRKNERIVVFSKIRKHNIFRVLLARMVLWKDSNVLLSVCNTHTIQMYNLSENFSRGNFLQFWYWRLKTNISGNYRNDILFSYDDPYSLFYLTEVRYVMRVMKSEFGELILYCILFMVYSYGPFSENEMNSLNRSYNIAYYINEWRRIFAHKWIQLKCQSSL